MATFGTPAADDGSAKSLSAHQVRIIADNINFYRERSRNLSNCVDAVLNYSKKGTAFTSNSQGRVKFKSIAKADRYTDHDTERLKKGQRQSNFTEHELILERSSFEDFEEMIEPTNGLNVAAGEAHGEFQDSFIHQTMFADALEANDDNTDPGNLNLGHSFTVVPFPTTQIIGVTYDKYHDGKADGKTAPTAADQGLNKSKLLGGRELLARARRKGKKVLTASELDIINLATSLQLTNVDYVSQKLLMEIERVMANESELFLGLTFKVLDPEVQVGYGTNAAVCGLHIDNAIEYRESIVKAMRIEELPTRHYNWQLYESLRAACLRNDDLSVAKIMTNQTATPV